MFSAGALRVGAGAVIGKAGDSDLLGVTQGDRSPMTELRRRVVFASCSLVVV